MKGNDNMEHHYHINSIPNNELAKIRACSTTEDFLRLAETQKYNIEKDTDEHQKVSLSNLGDKIYDFGKSVNALSDIQSKNDSIFQSNALQTTYHANKPVVCTKDDILSIIDAYKAEIKPHYELLREEKDTNPESPYESTSWFAETVTYDPAILDLSRICKNIDWERNTCVLFCE